ncbi:MAG: acetyl/propionyl-CoA carboxylase alpha subunit [Glaciecola sp.]
MLAAAAAVAPPTDDDVWGSLGPWRIAGVGGWPLRFADGEDEYPVRVTSSLHSTQFDIGSARIDVIVSDFGDGVLGITLDDDTVPAHVAIDGDDIWVHVPGLTRRLRLLPATHHADASAFAGASFAAPMPGAVVKVAVTEGQHVETGATLVVVEAMKMEHPVTAPSAGTVTAVLVAAGDAVSAGQALVGFEPDVV